jgi:23S rRNA (guanosine2251-2'-O)-methyltransferase
MSKEDDRDDLVYGIHSVGELLAHDPRRIRTLWLAGTRGALSDLFERARDAKVRVDVVDRRFLDRKVHGTHQGAVAQCNAAELADEAGLDAKLAGLAHPALLLALDGVQDPRNLGACLRSAAAAGVDAVLLPRRRSAPVSAVARKTASGAAESLLLVDVGNLARTLERLKDAGLTIIGAAGDAPTTWVDVDLLGPTVLVVGGEENGLRALTRAKCDALVSIPMTGPVASLNVSVAAGILLFEAVRQRRGDNAPAEREDRAPAERDDKSRAGH